MRQFRIAISTSAVFLLVLATVSGVAGAMPEDVAERLAEKKAMMAQKKEEKQAMFAQKHELMAERKALIAERQDEMKSKRDEMKALRDEAKAARMAGNEKRKAAHKKVCEKHVERLEEHGDRRGQHAGRLLEVMDAFRERVIGFHDTGQLTVENYDELLAAVDAARDGAQGAVSLIGETVEIDCEADDLKTVMRGARDSAHSARDSLKSYRRALVDLISAMRAEAADHAEGTEDEGDDSAPEETIVEESGSE